LVAKASAPPLRLTPVLIADISAVDHSGAATSAS